MHLLAQERMGIADVDQAWTTTQLKSSSTALDQGSTDCILIGIALGIWRLV